MKIPTTMNLRLRSASSIIFILISTFILTSCVNDGPAAGKALDALPVRSALVVKVNDWEELSADVNRNAIYQELLNLRAIDEFTEWLEFIPSNLRNSEFWVAAHASGAESYDLLFATEMPEAQSLPDSLDWQSREYSGTDIYSTTVDESEWHVCSFRSVLLISQSRRLVEEAIRQLDTEHSLEEDPDFLKAYKTVNSKDALNLLVNYGEISGLLEYSFPNAPLSFLGNMGTWAAYDLALNVDDMMLSGIHLNSDSSNSWLSCFSGIRGGDFPAQSLLPTNTAQAVMVNVGSFSEYNRNYQEYLRKDDRQRMFSNQIGQLGFSIEEALLSWSGGEFGLISLETSPEAVAQPRIAYIKALDSEMAIESMKIQADADFIENHRNYIIQKSSPKNLLLLGYGRIFKDMISPYYTVHGDYILFGNNLLTLKGYINDLMDGRVLPNQATFTDALDEVSSNAHVRVIHKNPGAAGLVRRLIDQDETDEIDDNLESLSKVAWAITQYKVDDDVSYSQIFAKHQEEYIPEAKQLWALPLKGEVLGRPQFVLNHYTNKNEIVVQDESNTLYLINAGGEVLWQRELDGPIMGLISQVDLFRNNKLQLAFNTSKFLYIIDRNGKDVAPFPVALPHTATAPAAVFDYDGVKNYRFVIPCGTRVLNYSKEGKQVDGWAFTETESAVIRQPQHFTVGTRDFIVIRESSGKVHIVSRRGETRIPTEDLLPDTHNDLYLSVGATTEETRIISLSEGGQLVSLFMNGQVDSTDIDLADDRGEFIFRDGKYIITQNGRLIVKEELHPFNIDLDADLSSPLYFMRNGTPIYGVVINDKDQVWLYGQTGEPLPGLPLYGSSMFTVGEFGQAGVLNLIVGTRDGNLLNYKLE
ncbi:DUF3352 domain-containing protein [Phaeocystidibacter luteus]|uniref:DUF3352 domain-containing protein n=2 Tax=Phaeocystidibacter luteus TaxID=911197 RepID=A0A6N6RIY1_9FLAO|nr:DUF3352 domain-containing protein [Phaeocystidibacter luteus]